MKAAPFLLTLLLPAASFAAEEKTIHSQPSWVIRTPQIELAVTQTGAHMAPVTFYRDSAKPVRPYHISPWQDEGLKHDVPVLAPLRGDWFCMPFGGNSTAFNGEQHPPHGEVAGSAWQLVESQSSGERATLKLAIDTKVRKGRVTKELTLLDGQNVIYSSDTIEGFTGPAPLGHHATLAMPDAEGVARIAHSPIQFGMTNPTLFSDPAKGEYQSFAIGARFNSLTQVPLRFKDAPDADVTRLPARRGFADLLQIIYEPAEVAWLTVTRVDEGFLWFSLKDPSVLRSTVFWIENHGRHGAPWNGRNNCLGLEDVTAHFADGLPASAQPNVLTKAGVKTAIELTADHPTVIRYIQGVVKVPAGFEQVKTLRFGPGQVIFVSTNDVEVAAPVKHEFLKTGKL
ncbi:MAG: hypothetical protein U1F71_07900 [Verrucomicrobiaceae bacterium]